jgi:hypothetical protein
VQQSHAHTHTHMHACDGPDATMVRGPSIELATSLETAKRERAEYRVQLIAALRQLPSNAAAGMREVDVTDPVRQFRRRWATRRIQRVYRRFSQAKRARQVSAQSTHLPLSASIFLARSPAAATHACGAVGGAGDDDGRSSAVVFVGGAGTQDAARAHIANEILQTEESYVRSLSVLSDRYMAALRRHMVRHHRGANSSTAREEESERDKERKRVLHSLFVHR